MNRRLSQLLLAIAICSPPRLLFAQSNQVSPADAAAARAVVARFVDAVIAGDADQIKQTLTVSSYMPEQTVNVVADMIAARVRLEGAAAARFGEAGAALRSGHEFILSGHNRAALAKAAVTPDLDPRNAVRIEWPGQTAPTRVRRIETKWRLILEFPELALEEDTTKPQHEDRLKRLQRLVEAVDGVARRVESGALTTAPAAEEELAKAVATAGTPVTPRK